MSGLIATSKASEHPSLASILLTGAARGRREAQQDAVALRTPLPLPCRVLVAPLGGGCRRSCSQAPQGPAAPPTG